MAGSYNMVTNNCQKFALGMVDLILEGQRERFVTSYSTSAIEAAQEFKIRPAVKVFATEATAKEVMHAAQEKENAEAKAAGVFPGSVMCKLFDTVEEAEAATKAYDAEEAAKAEEVAKAAAEAAKTAAEELKDVSVKEVTVVGEVAPDSGHVEQVDFAKQLMEEQTPVLNV